MLKNKQVLVGVTGGIAAYKIPLLVREFVKRGADVRVLMTESAQHFVTPLTLSTLSGRPVIVGTFPSAGSGHAGKTWHIDLARTSDLMVIAPATANVTAKLANGIADDAVTTLALAFRKRILICPAMDFDMWDHPATRQNITSLMTMGYDVLPPDEGELASGLEGPGRLPEIDRIADEASALLSASREDFSGRKLLVTAGPTHEAIDPVRYIGNRSSGKMGFAIALAASLRGADVTLIAGPVHIPTPRNIKRIDVESAAEMHTAAMRHRVRKDGIVMAAAVADFLPGSPSRRKIKKSPVADEGLTLELQRSKDILLSLAGTKRDCPVVGFALETHDTARNAKKKLKEKKVDLLVLNNPLTAGAGFGSDTNVVTIFHRTGRSEKLPKMSKFDVANMILDRLKPLVMKKRRGRK